MTLSITATADNESSPPSAVVTVTDTTVPPVSSVTVLRVQSDGTTATVRTADGLPASLSLIGGASSVTLVDREVPFGQTVTYTVENTSAISDPVVVDSTRPWLVHLTNSAASMPVTIAELAPRTREVVEGVLVVMGRRRPLVVTDGIRRAAAATITVRTDTLAEQAALDLLLDDARTLLLNVPADQGWGVTWEYIAVSTSQEERLIDYAPGPRRYWVLPYRVVDSPAGGSFGSTPGGGGDNTWAALALQATTWGDAATLYATWSDASAGV